MEINDELMYKFRKNPLDERKQLEMEAKEHIIKAKAMRDILLNDTGKVMPLKYQSVR